MKAAGSHEERLELWSEVLQLDEFEVVHQAENSETKSWQLTVVPKVAVAVCPHCGILSREIHQQRDREGIRDLPLGQRAVMLRVRVFEFWCVNCERAFTPPLKSLAAGTHATERFLERAARLIRHGDIQNVASFLGVPEKTLERWYYDYVERQQQQPQANLQPITSVGVDELSQKKDTGNSWP